MGPQAYMSGRTATGGHQRHELGLESLQVPSWRASRRPGGVMGMKLVVEVLDHYHGPDARKLWLVAWAEKANDRTRTGWPTRGVLSHRTGRSPSRVSHISDELVTEGVLKRDGGGNRSGPARFVLLPLADDGKGALKPHPKEEVEGAAKAHPEDPVKGAPRAHPKPKVKGAESKRKGAESGTKGADPSPQPAETGSLPLIPSQEQPSEELPTVAVAEAPTTQTILAAFIDWVREQEGNLTRQTIGRLAKQIGDLLAQDVPDKHIRQGLADWFLSGQNAATFTSFVETSRNADARAKVRAKAAANGVAASRESTGNERAREAIEAGRRVQAYMDQSGDVA